MDLSLKIKLDTLKNYLSNLPDTLPLPEPGLAIYNFELFDISAEEIDDYGEVGAVNRRLEISFGTRRNGPIVFTERGPGLVGVIEVLIDNSSRRNRQDLETLQYHIKIRQRHHAGPGTKNENVGHKPMLKWREIESTLGKRANSQVVDKSLPPAGRAAPRPRLECLDGESLGNGTGTGKDVPDNVDDGNDWLDELRQLDPAAVGVERHTFALGGHNDIDLNSSYLRDILSDTDMFQTHAETASTSRNDLAPVASGSSSATKPPPASTDWDSW